MMKKLRGSWRHTAWDPCLIISQILAMQSILYLTLSILIAISQDLTGATRSLDHVFKYHEIHVRDSEGQGVIVAYVLNALLGAVMLWLIVGRTKLCLDFSVTWWFLHLGSCWIYNGHFPTTWSWWALCISCAAATCFLGEILCLKSELREIPLSMAHELGPKVDL